jgi:hypothetical protein
MRRPGDVIDGKKLDIVPGHIGANVTYLGFNNWA